MGVKPKVSKDVKPVLSELSPKISNKKRKSSFGMWAVDETETDVNSNSNSPNKTEMGQLESPEPVVKKKKMVAGIPKLKVNQSPKSKTAKSSVEPKRTGYIPGWTFGDLLQLIRKIEESSANLLPLEHSKAISEIDWDVVSFKDFTGELCKTAWMKLHEKSYSTRELLEEGQKMLLENIQEHPDYAKIKSAEYSVSSKITKSKVKGKNNKEGDGSEDAEEEEGDDGDEGAEGNDDEGE